MAEPLQALLHSIRPSLPVPVGSQLAEVAGTHSWASDPEDTLAPEDSPAPEGKLAAVDTLRNLEGVAVHSLEGLLRIPVDLFPGIQERCLSCRLSPALLAWPLAEKAASLLATSCIAWPGLQLPT